MNFDPGHTSYKSAIPPTVTISNQVEDLSFIKCNFGISQTNAQSSQKEISKNPIGRPLNFRIESFIDSRCRYYFPSNHGLCTGFINLISEVTLVKQKADQPALRDECGHISS